MEIIRISDIQNFEELRPHWNKILSESGSDNIFLTWEWMFNWWKIFANKNDELCILAGVEEGKIIAIAPFYLRKRYLKELRLIASGIVCSEYLSCICRSQDAHQFAKLVYAYLRKNNRQWDLISFEGNLTTDEIISEIKSLARAERLTINTMKKHRCFYLPLKDQKTTGPLNKKIEYRKRKLGRRGELKFEQSGEQTYTEVRDKFNTLIELHQKRWKELQSKNGGLFDNLLFREFMNKITEVFHENHWLNICILTLKGKAVAAYYNFTFNGKIFGYLTGFEPEHKNCSPGSVCLWDSLLYFGKKGFTEFDFLRGEEEYKRDWSEKFREIEDAVIIQKRVRTFLFIRAIAFFRFLREIARKMLSPRVFAYIRAIKFKKSR